MTRSRRTLAKPVGADCLFPAQSPDSREWPTAAGESGDDHDLIIARCGGHPHLDRVEVTADERRIFVMKRHVDRVARTAHLLRRRDDRGAAAKRRAHRRSELRMQERCRVLQFPGQPDNGCLAETLSWLTLE